MTACDLERVLYVPVLATQRRDGAVLRIPKKKKKQHALHSDAHCNAASLPTKKNAALLTKKKLGGSAPKRKPASAKGTSPTTLLTASAKLAAAGLSRPPDFVLKLHSMFGAEPDLIRWDGGKITIIGSQNQIGMVLSRYFRTRKFTSFQRQLTNFGFHKSVKESSRSSRVYVRHDMIGSGAEVLLDLRRKQNPEKVLDEDDFALLDAALNDDDEEELCGSDDSRASFATECSSDIDADDELVHFDDALIEPEDLDYSYAATVDEEGEEDNMDLTLGWNDEASTPYEFEDLDDQLYSPTTPADAEEAFNDTLEIDSEFVPS